MARFVFGTGKWDKKSKVLMNTEVIVYGKNEKEALTKAKSFAVSVDDIYLKSVEETPNDTQ